MLVDLQGLFNYHHNMTDTEAPPIAEKEAAATQEPTNGNQDQQPESEASSEKIGGRRRTEVQNVTNALFRRRINQEPAKIDADPAARKIYTSEYLSTLTAEQIKDGKKMPGPSETNTDGEVKGKPLYTVVGGKRVRITDIIGADTDTLKCKYLVDEGDDAPDAPDAAFSTGDIPRQQIKEAVLLVEQEDILKGLEGDERAVAETYFKVIDPEAKDKPESNKELSGQIEKVAERNGMITATVILEAADAIYKGDPPEEVMLLLADFDAQGKTVLDRNDLEAAFNVLGVDESWFDTQENTLVDQLLMQQSELEKYTKADADASSVIQKIDELKAQLALTKNAGKLWRDKEAADTSPLDNYLDKAANGELDPRFVNELRSGKLDSVLDGVYEEAIKNMSDAEKAELKSNFDKLKSGSWKTIKFGGLLLAVLAAIPAAAAAGAVVAGTQAMGGAGGGRR